VLHIRIRGWIQHTTLIGYIRISVALYFYFSVFGSLPKKQTFLYVVVFDRVGCEGSAGDVECKTVGCNRVSQVEERDFVEGACRGTGC
jgi:hypothetical protein